MGVLISAMTKRHATAASLAVATWFVLVLFWDLGILAALVATDGAVPQALVGGLTVANPAGLYRLSLMGGLSGVELEGLGLGSVLPGPLAVAALWTAWIAAPLAIGAGLLGRKRAVTS